MQEVLQIQEFLENSGMSQSELARKANLSTAVVSQVLKGKYAGDAENVLKKILAVIKQETMKRKVEIKRPEFCATTVYKNITYALQTAQVDGNIVVLTGDAGLGKTESIRQFKLNNPQAILIEVDPSYKDSTLLEEIASELGIERMRKDRLFKAIVDKLSGTDRMIIVDEADYLNVKALDILRRIHDKANVPVVLVGLERLLRTISSMNEKYRQIFSRMIAYRLKPLTLEDTEAMVRSVIEDVSKAVIDRIYKITKGNARDIVNLLIVSQRIAHLHSVKIDVEVVKTASEVLAGNILIA